MELVRNIKALAKLNEEVSDSLRPDSNTYDRKAAATQARKAYLLSKPATHRAAATNGAFEGMSNSDAVAFHTQMADIPLLSQLLMHSQIMVDIRPFNPREFAAHYGVTAPQMADLARLGLVVPNLADYKNRAPNFEFYRNPDFAHLAELFEFEKTGAQINYLLQKSFMPESTDAFKSEIIDDVRWAVSHLDSVARSYLTNDSTESGAATALTQHLAYLKSFKDLEKVCDEFREMFRERPTSFSEIWKAAFEVMSTSRSNVHVLSGAFGGHLEPDRKFMPFWRYSNEKVARPEQLDMLGELEFQLVSHGMRILELESLPKLPPPPTKSEWNHWLTLLQAVREDGDLRDLRAQARKSLASVLQSPKAAADDPAAAYTYIRGLAKSAQGWAKWGKALPLGFVAVGSSVGTAAGAYLAQNAGLAAEGILNAATLGSGVGAAWFYPVSLRLFSEGGREEGDWLAKKFAHDGHTILKDLSALARTVDEA